MEACRIQGNVRVNSVGSVISYFSSIVCFKIGIPNATFILWIPWIKLNRTEFDSQVMSWHLSLLTGKSKSSCMKRIEQPLSLIMSCLCFTNWISCEFILCFSVVCILSMCAASIYIHLKAVWNSSCGCVYSLCFQFTFYSFQIADRWCTQSILIQ